MNNEGNGVIYVNPADRLDERDTRDTSDPHARQKMILMIPVTEVWTLRHEIEPWHPCQRDCDGFFVLSTFLAPTERNKNNILASRIEAVPLIGMKRADKWLPLCVWRLICPQTWTVIYGWRERRLVSFHWITKIVKFEEMQMSYV
jgi:hypothetical protein